MASVERRRRTERWFVRRGVPHFIDDYSAQRDIFTRAAPLLAVVALVEMAEPMRNEAPWWFNVGVVGVALALVLGAFAAVNHLRHRPWNRRPDTIGAVELAVFVLIGPAVQLAFGETANAAATVVGNLVFLGVVFLVTSYGLLPMTRWAVELLVRQLGDVVNLMMRSLPLLLAFTMFMFINAELWSIAAATPAPFLVLALGLLVVVGSGFLVIRMPRELADVARWDSWEDLRERVRATPVADLVDATDGPPPESPPLSVRARVNVGLVLFVSQAIQIVFVTVAIGAFYTLFGLFTVGLDTIALWTGDADAGRIATWTLGDLELVLTGSLLRSAAFVAAIGGLQFTVSALTDQAYREEFVEESRTSVRTNLAVRAVYLAELSDPVDEPLAVENP